MISIRSLLAIMSALLISACISTFEQTRRPPNVVVILIDDLSHYGMTAYGSSILRSKQGLFPDRHFSTPNIDALAYSGLRVDRAYAYPLCENTRIALLTGKGNERNFLMPKAQHQSDVMMSDIFARAGYSTGLFGKWKQSRGTPETPAANYLSQFAWQDYTAFDVVEQGSRFMAPDIVRNGEVKSFTDQEIDPDTGRRTYGPDIFNRDALAFVERNKDRPFLLYYPMVLVHDPHTPTPSTVPNAVFDAFDPHMDHGSGIMGDDPSRIFDMIEYADMLIGRLVDRIDDLGLREDTLIVVMGDNGTKEIFSHVLSDGSVYPGGKGRSADHGTHVGLILNQPGTVPPGNAGGIRAYDGMVFVTDILPTIMQAAGIAAPPNTTIDGKSFWRQAIGQSRVPARDHINYWYIGNGNYADEWNPIREHGVFDKAWKWYAPNKDFPDGRLFDLTRDPFEQQGSRSMTYKWGMKRHSGLPQDRLDAEPRRERARLQALIARYAEIPVTGLAIGGDDGPLSVGETRQLTRRIIPAKATRTGVIWTSSDPAIASIDKFGLVTAHAPGTAEIRIYSWDDAWPRADNTAPAFRIDGISASMTVTVSE